MRSKQLRTQVMPLHSNSFSKSSIWAKHFYHSRACWHLHSIQQSLALIAIFIIFIISNYNNILLFNFVVYSSIGFVIFLASFLSCSFLHLKAQLILKDSRFYFSNFNYSFFPPISCKVVWHFHFTNPIFFETYFFLIVCKIPKFSLQLFFF